MRPRVLRPGFVQKLASYVEIVAAIIHGEMSSSFTGDRRPERSSTYSYSTLPWRSTICAPPDGCCEITSPGDLSS